MVKVLGWVSLGLGVATVAVPRGTARFIGVDPNAPERGLLRGLVGMREIAAGLGILLGRRPEGWVRARVAGDLFDLVILGWAYLANARDRNRRRRVAVTTLAVAGITAADAIASTQVSGVRRSNPAQERNNMMHARAAITIRRPIEDVFAFWHDFENLPRFMHHLESVQVLDDGRSRWKARRPGGFVEWEAEVVRDSLNEQIDWRAVPDSDVQNSGTVRFAPAPAGQGTEVAVRIDYAAPGGALGVTVAKLFGEEPGQQIRDDLRRFKQVMETGEVVRSEGSPAGTSGKAAVMQRPARPLSG